MTDNTSYTEPQMSRLSLWYDKPAAEDIGSFDWTSYNSKERSSIAHVT